MSIKCGTCGGRHPSIAAVRSCTGANKPEPALVGANSHLRQYTVNGGDDPAEPGMSPLRPAWVTNPATPGARKYALDRLSLREWANALDWELTECAMDLMDGKPVAATICSKLIDELGKLPYRQRSKYEQAPEKPVSAPPAPSAPQTTPRVDRAAVRALKAQVPDSRYAVEVNSEKLRFFLVKTTDKGYLVIKEYASDTLHDRRYAEYSGILQAIIDAGPEAAQVRFGQEMGSCYHCNRALTDELSRKLGIGPVCRNK